MVEPTSGFLISGIPPSPVSPTGNKMSEAATLKGLNYQIH